MKQSYYFTIIRPASLSQKQEEMLNAFCSFVDKYLLPASVEKRSVALKLCVELVSPTGIALHVT